MSPSLITRTDATEFRANAFDNNTGVYRRDICRDNLRLRFQSLVPTNNRNSGRLKLDASWTLGPFCGMVVLFIECSNRRSTPRPIDRQRGAEGGLPKMLGIMEGTGKFDVCVLLDRAQRDPVIKLHRVRPQTPESTPSARERHRRRLAAHATRWICCMCVVIFNEYGKAC